MSSRVMDMLSKCLSLLMGLRKVEGRWLTIACSLSRTRRDCVTNEPLSPGPHSHFIGTRQVVFCPEELFSLHEELPHSSFTSAASCRKTSSLRRRRDSEGRTKTHKDTDNFLVTVGAF
jgi:hypothetical protein